MTQLYTPGSRIEVRDAEWRIKRIDYTNTQDYALTCEGISELVRGREVTFLASLEKHHGGIRILDPAHTRLVEDQSSQYRASRVYLASLIRQSVPADSKIYLGHQAALDTMAYQLQPAWQALQQPRQRILIADSVGLGKTISAGILTSELIARGKGKRILVLAVKSMLNQFQQEFWSRFTIGLTRLDSQGLQRVRNRIPSNHNPFHVFDRAIISIDTLKQDIEYRHYIEQAYWDIIIIDEAHNVAERAGHSQRSRLAKLLATRSDTLIMLSATPHDGKPESFASLVNMLDATAIANPSDYSADDFSDKGLVIRRFKNDIKDQLSKSFPDRDIDTLRSPASLPEEHCYDCLINSDFKTLKSSGAGRLFRTTLTKALFSSPAALLSTLANRQRLLENRLAKSQDSEQQANIRHDLDQIASLQQAAKAITPASFSKYQRLLQLLAPGSDFNWQPEQKDDRLVIFTESVQTLEFLAEHLPKALKLKKDQFATLRGDMADKQLTATVDSFNQGSSPLRLLLCSDVASEGINLHHLSHRMVHFDIPWSLMVFQQRNGRIDRYGQSRQPLIRYLLTDSQNAKIKGDNRILEILIQKDEQAGINIGDPSEFSQQEGEDRTALAMEAHDGELDLDALLNSLNLDAQADDSLAAFTPQQLPGSLHELTGHFVRIFGTDYDYAKAALQWLQQDQQLDLDLDIQPDTLRLTAPDDLYQRRTFLPREVWPDNNRFVLTSNTASINRELQRCREEDSPWPAIHYLWPLHPVMEWLGNRALNAFGRHTAPIIRQPQQLAADEHWILLQGGYPNRRGQMFLQDWSAVHLRGNQLQGCYALEHLLARLPLDSNLINSGQQGTDDNLAELQALLPTAIAATRQRLAELKTAHERQHEDHHNQQMAALDQLKGQHLKQLELDLAGLEGSRKDQRRQQREHEIERIFDDYLAWLENTQLTENEPYIQVAAVITGSH